SRLVLRLAPRLQNVLQSGPILHPRQRTVPPQRRGLQSARRRCWSWHAGATRGGPSQEEYHAAASMSISAPPQAPLAGDIREDADDLRHVSCLRDPVDRRAQSFGRGGRQDAPAILGKLD